MSLWSWMKAKSASVPLFSKRSTYAWGTKESYSTRGVDFAELYAGWVFACVRAITEQVAQIDLRLFSLGTDGQKDRVFDHPALVPLSVVNDFMTPFTLMERLQGNLELKGGT